MNAPFNTTYTGEQLHHVAFPLGGIGAGMICLEGTGSLSHVSLRHAPDIHHEPYMFSAISVIGRPKASRVLEGPVPGWKIMGRGGGGGGSGTTYGLPRFSDASFRCRFPFATVDLSDPEVPLDVAITGWSPFQPGDADGSSLPAAALEYRFTNRCSEALEAVFSHNAKNFMAVAGADPSVQRAPGGFILSSAASENQPWTRGDFCAAVTADDARVNCGWFRGGWWDAGTMAWQDVARSACHEKPPPTDGPPSPGGTIFVPLALKPGQGVTITLQFSWHVPTSNYRYCSERSKAQLDDTKSEATPPPAPSHYRAWYVAQFKDIHAVSTFWRDRYPELRKNAMRFRRCFYDSTLPPEVIEAVAANLAILKSPTVLRQADGRLWCFEGCRDTVGCCAGSCTHVWNYAQALPHLFPDLERTLRATEFNESQDESGHQQFRSSLPVWPTMQHDFHAASDGQLGGILKVFREWRISGDTQWMADLWPRVRASLDYCISTWDPHHKGVLEEPHHNTYDIEFWGPDSMCSSFYLGALSAAVAMGQALGEDVHEYEILRSKGKHYLEDKLFNGDYFFQEVQQDKAAPTIISNHAVEPQRQSPEATALFEREGPHYQYGTGCLADGVIGAWMAAACGLGEILDPGMLTRHLLSVHRHNLKHDLSHHANPQRPTFALGHDGGLLLCTWPRGGKPSLPFVYSDEVWTGIEYQVASHLMLLGHVEEGLEIVRTCRRRYDGRTRNPFNEYECGHWYARAMSSYALLQGLTGARYDAVDKTLYLAPRIEGDFRSFIAIATGYGTVGVRNGEPFLDMCHGNAEVKAIHYEPCKVTETPRLG